MKADPKEQRGRLELQAVGASPTRLVFVRHAETELTAQRRYSGRCDAPLTPLGQAQAEAAATRVAALSVTAVLTSPLVRCVATAEAIAKAAGNLPVVREPAFLECDFGSWEGLRFADICERWPNELDAWLSSTAVAPPGGESFEAVARRVRSGVTRLRQAHPGQPVAVVAHASPIKIVLRDALDAGDAFLHRLQLDPGALSIVDFYQDGGIAVCTINDTAHLLPLGPV